MSSVQCAKCLKDFDWKDSYHSRNTPGAHLHKSPGQGDWWPRAFCPHCGFLVAEWDIDHSQNRNRWKWHGANAKLNTGKELPPSPLAWWGMEEIPDDALVTVQEDHIDIKRVRRLFGHGPTEEVEEIAVTAEELLGNPSPTCKHTLTGEGKKATEQIIEIEADSLEEAREQMKSLTPEGFHLLSEQIIWDGKPQTVQISADTIVAAFAKAETLIPVGAEILEKKELSAPEQKVIRVEAEDEDGIEMSAKRTYQIRGAKFKNIRLITPGSKGLLGLGKKANLYEVEVHRTAVVSISYRTKAKISAKIGEKKEEAKGSSTSSKLAYLLIMGQGPKPADELRYVQQVVRSLVPEALASSSARISTRWQTGPVDQYYIIGAAYTSFGPLDTDKYDLETQDFFDAVGGRGVILKVFHKELFAGSNKSDIM